MIAALILLLILCFIGFKAAPLGSGFADYMSLQKTTCVKGAFALLIVFSHMRGYIALGDGFADQSFSYILNCIGQLMVTQFLFYSGYGVAQSVEKKPGYVKTIPKRRMLPVWWHFAVIVAAFLLANLAFGRTFELRRIILSFLAWDAVRNSNWYIFCILAMYLITWLSFTAAKSRMIPGALLLTAFSVVYVIIMYSVRGDSEHYWWDTALCYPLGVWYSIAKPRIDGALLNKPWRRIFAALAACTVFISLWFCFRSTHNRIYFVFCALALALTLTFVSMTVCLGNNRVLFWLGKRAFGLYALQRLPMMVLHELGVSQRRYAFAAASVLLTVAVAGVFEYLFAKADKRLR